MVAIKGMEMPTRCSNCPEECYYERLGGHLCTRLDKNTNDERWEKRLENCPLVEIVTCKDCKYCEEVHYENEGEPTYIKLKCNSTRNTRFYRVEEDFYCGDAERIE